MGKRKRKTPIMEICGRCDGCGWYEGGAALTTPCEICKGTGEVEWPIDDRAAKDRSDGSLVYCECPCHGKRREEEPRDLTEDEMNYIMGIRKVTK